MEHVVTISQSKMKWVIDQKLVEAKRGDTIVWKFDGETSAKA